MTKHRRIRIADIKICKRFRKDIGKLDGLAESIRQIGLLHPIIITEDLKLVAGHRRLLACKTILKWKKIDATVIET